MMKFLTFSLGCKVNSYECSAISSMLLNKGFIEAKNDMPDVVIINTCSVTATADQKSRQHIRKFQHLYPHAILIVMGCYAQGNSDYIFNEIKPTILIGTSHRKDIPFFIEQYLKTHTPIIAIDDDPRRFGYEELGVTSYCENVRAYLKIQDGCNNFCSYCLIPYRRGKLRSRNSENIKKEVCYLIKKGYQEIVLTGIHVGGYGQDLENINFSSLVKDILEFDNLKSLRISSIEESEIDEELISLFTKYSNLALHLHIPLQSGASSILKKMGRKYDKNSFLSKIKTIKQHVPNIMISTDIIVGFPSESEEDFQETYDFIKECGFHQIHVFPFSAREGTPAYKMKDQVDSTVKKRRVNRLLSLSKDLWNSYIERFIGQNVKVLVEKYQNGQNIGHTSNYIEVSIPSREGKIGQFIDVRLTKDMINTK